MFERFNASNDVTIIPDEPFNPPGIENSIIINEDPEEPEIIIQEEKDEEEK